METTQREGEPPPTAPTARIHAARLTGDGPEAPDLVIVGLSPELLRQLLGAPHSGDAIRIHTPDGEKPLTLMIYNEPGNDAAFEAHLPTIAANVLTKIAAGRFPAAPPTGERRP